MLGFKRTIILKLLKGQIYNAPDRQVPKVMSKYYQDGQKLSSLFLTNLADDNVREDIISQIWRYIRIYPRGLMVFL
jgi:hypothetical protein